MKTTDYETASFSLIIRQAITALAAREQVGNLFINYLPPSRERGSRVGNSFHSFRSLDSAWLSRVIAITSKGFL